MKVKIKTANQAANGLAPAESGVGPELPVFSPAQRAWLREQLAAGPAVELLQLVGLSPAGRPDGRAMAPAA